MNKSGISQSQGYISITWEPPGKKHRLAAASLGAQNTPGLGIRTDSPQFNRSEAPNVPSSSQSVKMGSSFYRSVTKVILTTDSCPEYSAGYLV